jgi:hypothetical protein
LHCLTNATLNFIYFEALESNATHDLIETHKALTILIIHTPELSFECIKSNKANSVSTILNQLTCDQHWQTCGCDWQYLKRINQPPCNIRPSYIHISHFTHSQTLLMFLDQQVPVTHLHIDRLFKPIVSKHSLLQNLYKDVQEPRIKLDLLIDKLLQHSRSIKAVKFDSSKYPWISLKCFV